MARSLLVSLTTLALLAAACSSDGADATPAESSTTTTVVAEETTTSPPTSEAAPESTTTAPLPTVTEDRAYYILPPGNYGGVPVTDESLDQLALYDGLTPLRDDITDADLDTYFLPNDFEPVGATTIEDTGRAGTTIEYDEFGVAHITGETREDLAFGAGWVTARDRDLLISLGRGPARVAVADVPGIDAFGLVTSLQQFVPSEATEQLVTDQVQLIIDTYGEEGEEIIADAQAYADGMNAFWESTGAVRDPFTVNDVIAVTAFIGSIFGAGGGSEALNAQLLGTLQNRLGDDVGRQAWEDLLPGDDPEAPTTLEERFDYPVLTGGEVTGSVVLDEGSLISFDPRDPADGSAPALLEQQVFYDAVKPPPSIKASNWLLVDPEESVNGTTLAVMGPQLGYYYPEIVMQIHLSGAGIEAQGAAVPGLALYMLIGRTEDYAWSLTSANQDVRDVYAEVLCEPDGGDPDRESTHYLHDGECIPFELFDAGTLGGQPIRYPVSVHGPVIGTALADGEPIALTRQRSTFGRDGLNLKALKDMTEGDAGTVEDFWEVADQFGFTFNWGYANREGIGYFASGYLPERAAGLDRRLPTLGTGEYEWQGFLDLDEHPHADGHPSGRLLNWNNQSAPGFMHGDGNQYGSWHRVENFDQWPETAELTDVVGVMNRAATEDTRASMWPSISAVLRTGDAPSPLAGEVVDLLDAWVADDAPRLDGDDDGDHDRAGPLLLDVVFEPLVDATLAPVYGDGARSELDFRGIDFASLLDKDLRSVVGSDVEGPFNLSYCGGGDLDACRESLWAAVDTTVAEVAAERGDDPTAWLSEGLRLGFAPNLIPETFRATNRPTFQQVIEFAAP